MTPRERQCDLGPVIGGIAAMTPIHRVRYRHPRWIEDGTAMFLGIVGSTVLVLLVMLGVAIAFMAASKPSHGRDLDGCYAQSQFKQWFDHLKSGKGLCCSLADGVSIKDADWSTDNGRYRVRVDGQWLDVPDEALVTVPNIYGPAVVWLVKDANGITTIRCFIAGALT